MIVARHPAAAGLPGIHSKFDPSRRERWDPIALEVPRRTVAHAPPYSLVNVWLGLRTIGWASLLGKLGRCHGVVRLPDQQQPDKQ
jgi:hypothetical protein